MTRTLFVLLAVLLAAPSWAATTHYYPPNNSCSCDEEGEENYPGYITFDTSAIPDNAVIDYVQLWWNGSYSNVWGDEPTDYSIFHDGSQEHKFYRNDGRGPGPVILWTGVVNKTGNSTVTITCESGSSWHYWYVDSLYVRVDYTVPNSLPTTGAVSGFPANFHYGTWFNISATVSDADGYANISYWHLLVNYGVDGSWACYLLLTHNGNYIQLLNNEATNWGSAYTMGSATYAANSQCQIDLANSSWSLSGNNATANLRIRFMPGALVRNPMNSYLWVTDAVGNSNWQGPKQTGYVRTRSKLIVRSN